MNRIFKKVFSAGSALFLTAALTAASAGTALASEIDAALEEQLVMMAEGLTETIIPLSDEEIESYADSQDDFTAASMEAWSSSKDELGELEEDGLGDAVVEMSDDGYSVTVPADFKKADANFVYTFSEEGYPQSMSVDVQYPLSVSLERAGLNTVMGLVTVFIMLIFLSFVISLFRFIPKLTENRKKEENKSEPAAETPAPVVQETDDGELVAVIAAAIAASEGTTTDGFVVRSIRKINRKK